MCHWHVPSPFRHDTNMVVSFDSEDGKVYVDSRLVEETVVNAKESTHDDHHSCKAWFIGDSELRLSAKSGHAELRVNDRVVDAEQCALTLRTRMSSYRCETVACGLENGAMRVLKAVEDAGTEKAPCSTKV